jgi:hypothetical protein
MIVQTAPHGQSHFVITQIDHARACGSLAESFGNDAFAAPYPLALMVYVAAHHDEGWSVIDDAPSLDENTRLPYHLTQTPLPKLLITSHGSPAHNESVHPFCGLISSMHTSGLYNGRYGLSDRVFINLVPEQYKAQLTQILDVERERQDRLKQALSSDPETRAWADERAVFANYKLLQFFDTLGLYFHMTHAEARTKSLFLNVPQAVDRDVTITLTPENASTYRLEPFPFSHEITLTTRGRIIDPLPAGATDDDLRQIMNDADFIEETVLLVS